MEPNESIRERYERMRRLPDYAKMKSNICEHLKPLEDDLKAGNYSITFRGSAWSENCREWVYFHCYLDRAAIEAKYDFPEFVVFREHCGTHDGREAGFVCENCHDAVMGLHVKDREGANVFKP